jgi:hypothetical protein
MSFKKWWALVASSALLGAMGTATGSGCSSSSSNNGSGDAGNEGGGIVHHLDSGGGGDDAGDGATGPTYDMTTGMPCTSDTMCKSANGPGSNICSTGVGISNPFFGVSGASPWPTPICMMKPPAAGSQGNCDPAPSYDPQGQELHFCDGPDDPSSPGICIPNNAQMPTSGAGFCYPKCTFAIDGSKQQGCIGADTCVPFTFVLFNNDAGVPQPPPVGYGYCYGACQQDADCSGLGTGYKCQVDLGFCTKTPVTREADAGGAVGAACTNPSGGTSTACYCPANTTTGAGYCTSSCVVGGNPCPTGYVCDNGLGGMVSFSNDGGDYTLAMQNPGTLGTCFEKCTAVDASAGCPPNGLCSNASLAGPDCVP